jgi:hypothetical protein
MYVELPCPVAAAFAPVYDCSEQMRCRYKNLYDMRAALRWATQTASALAALHEQQPAYVHNDVKADNVYLNDTARVNGADAKLGDLKPHRWARCRGWLVGLSHTGGPEKRGGGAASHTGGANMGGEAWEQATQVGQVGGGGVGASHTGGPDGGGGQGSATQVGPEKGGAGSKPHRWARSGGGGQGSATQVGRNQLRRWAGKAGS